LELPGWRLTPFGLDAPDAQYSIRYFHVRTQLREVPEWSQPLVLSHSHGFCLLALSIQNGVARVYLRIRQAPGMRDGAEIGPSLQLAPGQLPATLDSLDDALLQAAHQGCVLAEADNSQEGSRFFKDCIRYRIVLVDPHQAPDTEDSAWATLGALKHLIDRGGTVSNEMRSAVSFLLPLL
jgi:dTDP-4-dehydro-6-deoxy-alpha-D-glucopyranose 2,3-dehydratase